MQTIFGKLNVIKGDHITKTFEGGDYYEINLMKILLGSTPKTLAIDVGAHIGSHTLAYAHNFEKVVSIEPQKQCCEMLLKTLSDNDLENVEVINKAAMHRNYKVGIEIDDKNTGSSKINTDQNINAITIDSLKLKPGLIKIDTEGTEKLVIFGAKSTIKKYKPVVMWEINDYFAMHERLGLHDREIERFNIENFLMVECQYNRLIRVSKYMIAYP